MKKKWNNSTSNASKVRSRWGGVKIKGGVDLSSISVAPYDGREGKKKSCVRCISLSKCNVQLACDADHAF